MTCKFFIELFPRWSCFASPAVSSILRVEENSERNMKLKPKIFWVIFVYLFSDHFWNKIWIFGLKCDCESFSFERLDFSATKPSLRAIFWQTISLNKRMFCNKRILRSVPGSLKRSHFHQIFFFVNAYFSHF